VTYDVVVVGGGIVGLWVARHAVKAGLSVAVVDKAACGSGASGTVLGALLPHLPRVMIAKKAFQFEALAELAGLIDELEDETGRSAGYDRCGRIMAIRTERYLAHAEACRDGAVTGWRSAETGFCVDVLDADFAKEWIAPEEAVYGVLHDNLSARVIAHDYIGALKASLAGKADVFEGNAVTGVDVDSRQVLGADGPLDIAGRDIVFAAGYGTFSLVENVLGLRLGRGIKGQAAVFEIAPLQNPPIIYDDGVFIVPHGPGRCAVGSTNEDSFDDPTGTDSVTAAPFIARAKALSPALRDGRVLSLWAGVRPRCEAKDPIVGCLDAARRLHIATGGYKISFGIAHRMARRLIEEISNADLLTEIPECYGVGHHLEAMDCSGPRSSRRVSAIPSSG